MPLPLLPSHQLCGPVAIQAAFDSGLCPTLLLAQKERLPPAEHALVQRAQALGIPVRFESANDLRRMSRSKPPATLLALVGRDPRAPLAALLAGPGLVWILAGVGYPSNTGFIIRTVEVSGAAGVVIDGPFNRRDRTRALRISMRADRFMPVHWHPAPDTIAQARAAGRAIYAVEDTGDRAPWEVPLSGRVALVVGGERDGIPAESLAACDAALRLPMPGFIPSFNVQAAVAAVATERLRQRASLSLSDA